MSTRIAADFHVPAELTRSSSRSSLGLSKRPFSFVLPASHMLLAHLMRNHCILGPLLARSLTLKPYIRGMYSFIALVSGFVQGTGASCSSSSISTFDSVVGDAGVGVSLAGDAREETVGPGEAEDARPDGLCLPSDGWGKAGMSSGCCWNRR